MDYIHETIESDELGDIFDLPSSLKGRRVEVIILPIQETKKMPLPGARHLAACTNMPAYL
jgi:hypothetical protein